MMAEVTLKWLGAHVETVKAGEGEACCANCAHFYQHYVRTREWPYFTAVAWGHCATPRMKNKNALDTCPAFEQREPEKGEETT